MNTISDFDRGANQEESFDTLMMRTKDLSVPVSEIKGDEEKLSYLNFKIQGAGYVICTEYTHGVISFSKVTKVPGIPHYILGITDHRGEIITVFDFHRFLGYPDTKITSDSRLILVLYNNTKCGILVDEVNNVLKVPISAVEKNISNVEENISKYLNGMLRIDETLFAIVDISRIFDSDKIKKLKDLSEI